MTSDAGAWRGGLVDRNGGEKLWAIGDTVNIKIGSAHTDDGFMFGTVITHPRSGPPPHVHTKEDEAFYILDGEMEFLIGDKIYPAPVGSFVYAPRNVLHQFRNIGTRPATMLFWATDANFENFYREMALPAGAPDFVPPPIDGALIEKVLSTAVRYGMSIHPDADSEVRGELPDAKTLWVLGLKVRILCRGESNDQQLCVMDIWSDPGSGPPPHRHLDQHEIFHILDGTFEIRVGDQTIRAVAGDTVHAPPMVFHSFVNVSNMPGRLVSFHTPAGMEHFFEDCGVPYIEGAPQPALHLSSDQIAAIIHRHKMELPPR